MLPAQPALEAARQPLAPWERSPADFATAPAADEVAPWERSPADFATAPAADEVAPWPISTTGPMYVWNPAATGPIVAVGGDDEESD
jgi:hypothetical protein